MRVQIDVTRKEAKAIRLALADPQVRATVIVIGTLLQLPTDRSRERVLRYVVDELDENGTK